MCWVSSVSSEVKSQLRESTQYCWTGTTVNKPSQILVALNFNLSRKKPDEIKNIYRCLMKLGGTLTVLIRIPISLLEYFLSLRNCGKDFFQGDSIDSYASLHPLWIWPHIFYYCSSQTLNIESERVGYLPYFWIFGELCCNQAAYI